ncbi:MAG: hypothetical protein NTW07_10515, partial [candidate division Zixibacteria bacterium]|nr:hypothetical protein [candidate division Zixibacteria bacterium]
MLKRILVAGVLLLGLYTGAGATTWYVSKTGNDTRGGTSWGQAWLSLTNVNDSTRVRSGDTVQFATGIWREQLIVRHGANGAPTVYADSAFADVNGSGTSHFARFYGSDKLTTWTRIGTSSVYWCLHPRSVTATALYQNDSILWLKPSLVSVNSAGKWYQSADTVYAWAYGGSDPDNYEMEIADIQNLVVGNRGTTPQSYVTFYGLAFKYTYNHMFGGFGGDGITTNADYITFNRCYLSHNAGQGGNNPSLIYIGMSNTDADASVGWRFVNDSLGYDWDWYSNNDQSSSSVNACCIDVYISQGWLIEGCTFFGFQGQATIHFKSAQNTSAWTENDTLRYNVFGGRTLSSLKLYHRVRYLSIYGNIFRNAYANFLLAYGNTTITGTPGYHEIFNNSSYGATRWFEQANFEDNPCVLRPYAGQHHIKLRYNVVYSTGSVGIITDTVSMYDGAQSIDSNLYVSGSNTYSRVGLACGMTNQSLTTWQNTYGFDQRSRWSTTNPFDNINATDPWQGYAR